MSNKEKCMRLLDQLSEADLGVVAAMLQGIAEEAADDKFCEQLYQDYLHDPDPEKENGVPLEECMKEWGLA